ncbi:MAG: hypothetical protein A2V84_01170 [Chloroflexi bacterium RBG_16_70_13]|nr:MAG: hypothetical protein A2V84_01170 [Chloroflexi bacterium RBG_16_70_13]
MKTRTATITAAILLAGCASVGPSPSPVPAATASAPAVTATIAATPAAPATGPASVLEGTWIATSTCAQQAAAVDAAGFTDEQQTAAEWDAATCMDMGHGTRMQLRFSGERLIIFQDGVIGWDGVFRTVDADTFEAGDSGTYYLTYEFAVAGDQLTIDMVRDDFPTSDPAELAGEQIAQTVIYESAPFEKAS